MSDSKAARLAEILEGYFTEVSAGCSPDAEALVARNPDLAEDLRAGLASLDFFRRARVHGEEPDHGAGRAMGDFRIVREIGRGGMGVVYEAEQISLGRRVALKVLPFAAVLDPKQLQRFRNEAHAAANLHHTNIVPVYGVGCERGVHYYAMQYIEGESLAVAIGGMKGGGAGEGSAGRSPISSHSSNREPAYLRMAARLGVQAAEALDHAHQLGVVHRDIKPANLLVDAAGTLWITDFGLARSHTDAGLTMTGEIVGTLRYMSPEQALAKRVPVDHRTDIYSLGATLYELFTLELAFPGDNPPEVIHDLAFKDPVPPRRLNPALPIDIETILLKAMAKDAAGRYETAQEMADDLRRFLAHEPIRASPPTLLDRARKWARRHRTLVAAGAASLLLMLVGSVAGILLVAREKTRADRNFETSEQRRADAEHNLDVAREAIDEMLVKVGAKGLRDIPMLEQLRSELLKKASEFYGALLDRQGHDPALRHEAGKTWHKLGRVRALLGEHAQAEEAFKEAVQVLDELVREFPGVEEYRRPLSRAMVEWGVLYGEQGKGAEAEARFQRALGMWDGVRPASREGRECLADVYLVLGRTREALDIYEALLRETPEDQQLLLGKLDALRHLWGALMARGLHGEAASHQRETVELADRLLAASPHDVNLRDLCAGEHHNLVVVLAKLGQDAEAVRESRRCVEISKDLVRDFPSVPDRRHHLGVEHKSLALSLVRTGELQEAERHGLDSVEILASLVREHAGIPAYSESLVRAHWALVSVLRAQELFDAAEERSRNAADLCTRLVTDHPSADNRSMLARIQAELGKMYLRLGRFEQGETAYGAALEQFVELEKAGPLSEQFRYDRATVLLGFANLLRDAEKPAEAERLYRDASAIEDLVAQWPDSAPYRSQLAEAKHNLGALLQRTGRGDEGADRCEEARRHYAELVSRYPDSRQYRAGLAACVGDLGRCLVAAGRPREAETALREAVDLREEIVLTQPSAANKEALAKILDVLGDRVLRDRPAEAEPLLRRGIELREELARDAPKNPGYQTGLAGGLHNYADALRRLGRQAEAVALYERAIGIERAVLAADPADPTARGYLELHYMRLSEAFVQLGDHPRAAAAAAALADLNPQATYRREAAHNLSYAARVALKDERIESPERTRLARAYVDQAKALIEDLAASCPDDAKARDCLADEWCNVGARLAELGSIDESVACFEEARSLYDLVRERPDGVPYREEMSLCLEHLGHQLVASGRRGDAAEAFRDCIELRREIADADPSARNRDVLAHALDFCGSSLLPDRPAEAEAAFLDGLKLREALAHEEPSNPAHQVGLAGTIHNYANALAALGQREKAVDLYEQAIGLQRAALAADPDVRNGRSYLALHCRKLADVLLDLGDHARAAAAAAGLAETEGGDDEACWRLARCADLAAKDQRLKAPERAGVARAYAEQAKAILVGAAERTPGRPMPWGALGWASVRAGDWKGAVEALGKDQTGAGAFEWFLLATAQAHLGQAKAACRAYDRGVALMEAHAGDTGASAGTPASSEAGAGREGLEVGEDDIRGQRAEAARLLGLARSGG